MAMAYAAPRLLDLPSEIIQRVLWHLDVPDLLSVSRTCHSLRDHSTDSYLHVLRLRHSSSTLTRLLPRRPELSTLQPPQAAIYLSRTHLAARRLHWSLVCIRLNRSLSRRPGVPALVCANVLPRECCRKDRSSGVWVVSAASERGGLVSERKRRLEREKVKEGLRVWLERKAGEINKRRKEGGVAILVWRFTKKLRLKEETSNSAAFMLDGMQGRVKGLKSYWEGMSRAGQAAVSV